MADWEVVGQRAPEDWIESRIHVVRGLKVMLDSDLAVLYGVTTGNLNLAVKRNRSRFPEDFMIQLTPEEVDRLLLQFAIANPSDPVARRGGRRNLPYAFTEQGVAMLSSVLRSERAIQVNILVMRAFVRLRQIAFAHVEIAHKLQELERRLEGHDEAIQSVVDALRHMIEMPEPPHRKYGFPKAQAQLGSMAQ